MVCLSGVLQTIYQHNSASSVDSSRGERYVVPVDENVANKLDLEAECSHIRQTSVMVHRGDNLVVSSGFFITPNSMLITNAHAVGKGAVPANHDNKEKKRAEVMHITERLNELVVKKSPVKVEFSDSTRLDFRVIAVDVENDLALLVPVDLSMHTSGENFFRLADYETTIGQDVYLVGHPKAIIDNQLSRGKTLSMEDIQRLVFEDCIYFEFSPERANGTATGIITGAKYCENEGRIFTSCISDNGNSGGALIDNDGRVVGVHRQKLQVGQDILTLLFGKPNPFFRPTVAIRSIQVLDFLANSGIDVHDVLDGNEVSIPV